MSSAGRRWRGLSAELRFHPVGEIPPYVAHMTQIAILIRGASVVLRRSDGVGQRTVGTRGTIGLCPMGVSEDSTYVTRDIDEMLHVYLAPSVFVALAKHASRDFNAASVRNDTGFNDPLIEGIATEILGELQFETSCGDLLVETLADSLAVRLLNNYSSLATDPLYLARGTRGLDSRRLQRAVEYIYAHLTQEMTVEELASAASLSRFHFSRMFKAATGRSPSRFIAQLRLELAKTLLVEGKSLADIAQICGFSSESNFVRSFKRSTGRTPGQHRKMAHQ